MNKLIWLSYNGEIIELVISPITLPKLKRFVEVIEVETVATRPLSFRVVADRYLCKWLGISYQNLKSLISE